MHLHPDGSPSPLRRTRAGWRTLHSLAPISLWLLVVSFPSAGGQTPRFHYEANRVSMACTYAIEAYGPDPATLPLIVDAAFDEVDRIDRLMSNYKPESPLSHINREAADHAVTVDGELFDFLEDALRYSRDSDGAFDITVGPLMRAWGFFGGEGHLPSDAEWPPRVGSLARCTSRSIVVHARSASIARVSSWIWAVLPKAMPSTAPFGSSNSAVFELPS